jgi:NADH:ubiquinone oxidoreductase subunit H
VGVFNIVFVLLAAPLFDGVMRQVKARIHSRRGPSILQTYFDLGKLMVKEDQLAVNNFIFSVTPIICLGSVLLAALFVPMGGVVPLGFAGDTLVLVYVLTMGPICLCLGGMASGSPYAYLGVNREIMMLMVVEPVMAISLIASAIKAHSLMLADCIRQPLTGAPSFSLAQAGHAEVVVLLQADRVAHAVHGVVRALAGCRQPPSPDRVDPGEGAGRSGTGGSHRAGFPAFEDRAEYAVFRFRDRSGADRADAGRDGVVRGE